MWLPLSVCCVTMRLVFIVVEPFSWGRLPRCVVLRECEILFAEKDISDPQKRRCVTEPGDRRGVERVLTSRDGSLRSSAKHRRRMLPISLRRHAPLCPVYIPAIDVLACQPAIDVLRSTKWKSSIADRRSVTNTSQWAMDRKNSAFLSHAFLTLGPLVQKSGR